MDEIPNHNGWVFFYGEINDADSHVSLYIIGSFNGFFSGLLSHMGPKKVKME